jgi:hypothetical protein
MKRNSKWFPVTIALAALFFATAQVEPAAFASGPGASVNAGAADPKANAPATIPSAPEPRKNKRWKLIVTVAAVAAGVAAAVLTRGSNGSAITAGNLTVGRAQ